MISKNRLGVVIGSAFGLLHLIWVLLVAFGIAQWWMNLVFRLHFVEPVYVVTPFNAAIAVTLIVVTSAIGYVVGWIAAAIWNWLHTERAPAVVTAVRHAA